MSRRAQTTPSDSISRPSFIAAGVLAAIGTLRLGSDYLTDVSPSWGASLAGTWLRYVVRTASDGTVAGDLNVQYFKLLAIPCGISVWFFLNLLLAGSLGAADRRWRTLAVRLFGVGSLFALCTGIEIEKATHVFGLGLAGLLEGERPVVNHALHGVGAALGFWLTGRLRYAGTAPGMRPANAAFDYWAPGYDRSISQTLLFRPIHNVVVDVLGSSGAAPRDVIDVGCGTGRLLESVVERWPGARVTGIDASAAMIAEARGKHRGHDRFSFVNADAAALPFASGSFDIALSTVSLHHWQEQASGIREVARVLRPGGSFILVDIDPPLLFLLRPLLRWIEHAQVQGPGALRQMLDDAGLSVALHRRFWRAIRLQLFAARKT
jgi:ubiquinone/menaquinone biosynthesis C-methylase UbiE